jgi:putative Mn2+ efflux pump MntP
MDLVIIYLIALGLAMDACFISITKGIVLKSTFKVAITIALLFGGFEAAMLILGWIVGIPFENILSTVAPWIAFILISIIGIKMIYESFSGHENDNKNFNLKETIILAFTISVDSLLVGLSLALLHNPILEPALIIGTTSFTLSFIGFYIGKKLGYLFGKEIEILGGIILILIGLSFLIT